MEAREQYARDAGEAELAGPRMSTKMLCWLPLTGVVLTCVGGPVLAGAESMKSGVVVPRLGGAGVSPPFGDGAGAPNVGRA